MPEAVRRESAPELLWKPYNVNENGKSNSRMLMPSNTDNCFHKSEDSTDINGNYLEELCDGVDKLSTGDEENFNRFVSSSNFDVNANDICKGKCDDNCRNGDCKKSVDSGVEQRRKSTSDSIFHASDFANANSIPLSRSGAKSTDKMDKINLANLVFNPNFKTSAGCLNLPVIRAGQNLAQKNALRSSVTFTKDASKEGGMLSPKEFRRKTHQAALDLLSRPLQPQSLGALAQKLQQLSGQQKSEAGETTDSEDHTMASSARGLGCTEEILHTYTGKSQLAEQLQPQQQPQGNALRYKTELCRSHEEGGECRFGPACTFAHGAEELRPVPRHPLYKTELCRTYHQHGYCQYGTRCHFIHDADEADKNAPLKGCKSWGRHDQLSGAMLSLASSSGLLDSAGAAHHTASSSDNDVLLANLRRLYALRVMNGQEKTTDPNTQFSMSQPMGHQLSMAHQQLESAGLSGSRPLPLSMTQPLPMDALQMGLQRVGQLHPYHHQRASQQQYSQVTSNSRLESMPNDYSGWGVAPPPSPAYSGVSPFSSYHQQFSPLPHHQSSSSGYPGQPYSFSATAPDLSAALNMVSPYAMSPQSFSNTVNVGHYLQDPSANYAAAAAASANYHKTGTPSTNSQAASSGIGQGVYVGAPNPVWPQTSSEVVGAIDNELFGFGLGSHQNSGSYGVSTSGGGSAGGYSLPPHQQYQHPYYQSMAAYQQQQPHQHHVHEGSKMAHPEQSAYTYQSGGSAPNERTTETDLLSLLQGGYSDKYASVKESRTLGTISESNDGRDQSVRPKNRNRTSLGNVKLN